MEKRSDFTFSFFGGVGGGIRSVRKICNTVNTGGTMWSRKLNLILHFVFSMNQADTS